MFKGQEHTPEPWAAVVDDKCDTYFPHILIGKPMPYPDDSGEHLPQCTINEGASPQMVKEGYGGGTTMPTARANARRIADCVNACEGVPVPASLKACIEVLGRVVGTLHSMPCCAEDFVGADLWREMLERCAECGDKKALEELADNLYDSLGEDPDESEAAWRDAPLVAVSFMVDDQEYGFAAQEELARRGRGE